MEIIYFQIIVQFAQENLIEEIRLIN